MEIVRVVVEHCDALYFSNCFEVVDYLSDLLVCGHLL